MSQHLLSDHYKMQPVDSGADISYAFGTKGVIREVCWPCRCACKQILSITLQTQVEIQVVLCGWTRIFALVLLDGLDKSTQCIVSSAVWNRSCWINSLGPSSSWCLLHMQKSSGMTLCKRWGSKQNKRFLFWFFWLKREGEMYLWIPYV